MRRHRCCECGFSYGHHMTGCPETPEEPEPEQPDHTCDDDPDEDSDEDSE